MVGYRYSWNVYEENMARAVGRDLPISFKQSVEITKHLRNMELARANAYLDRVISEKEAVSFSRFTNGLGHKPGMASGRYPLNACTRIKELLQQVEANAQTKGLGKCKIIHISTQKADRPFHHGRHSRIRMKRAHVEVIVQEIEAKKDPKKHHKKGDKIEAKQEAKQESKPLASKEGKEEVKVSKDASKNSKNTQDIQKNKTKSKDPKDHSKGESS